MYVCRKRFTEICPFLNLLDRDWNSCQNTCRKQNPPDKTRTHNLDYCEPCFSQCPSLNTVDTALVGHFHSRAIQRSKCASCLFEEVHPQPRPQMQDNRASGVDACSETFLGAVHVGVWVSTTKPAATLFWQSSRLWQTHASLHGC